jgi:hypothetical protein
MTDRASIDSFLAGKRIAVVGVSARAGDFSRMVWKELAERGYDVVPVRPDRAEVDGRPAFARVQDIPGHVDGALLMTAPAATDAVVHDCADAGIDKVWMHRGVGPGAVSAAAVAFCRERGMTVIPGECPMMFLGAGLHRVHGRWRTLAGTYPTSGPQEPALAPALRALILVAHAAVGWLACAGALALLRARLPPEMLPSLRALVAPLVFALLSAAYFRERTAAAPFAAAAGFVVLVGVLDLAVGALSWLPLLLIFLVTLLVGGWSAGRTFR